MKQLTATRFRNGRQVKPTARHSRQSGNFFARDQIVFSDVQAEALHIATLAITAAGGPQRPGSHDLAARHAHQIAKTFDKVQAAAAKRFARGNSAMLEFQGMRAPESISPPDELPSPVALEKDFDCLYLASRSSINLHLAGQRAFAFDIDNEGKIARYVGNFKGGGKRLLNGESSATKELSSHTGKALGAHTEAPYHCCVQATDSHSPAPSSLVLTARFNPLGELTTVIPMYEVLQRIGTHDALALTLPAFDFSSSDSFTAKGGQGGHEASILEVDQEGAFCFRYNDYRFSPSPTAPEAVVKAHRRLRREIHRSPAIKINLQPSTAIVINNWRALHCRDAVEDNRRLLVRLFGYAQNVRPIVLASDPLIVKG